jgi:hypothetical protein
MRSGAVALAALLAACGQTGALYLPDAGVETPVEIRGPAAPAEQPPAAAPTPEPSPVSPQEPPAESPPEEQDEDAEKKPPVPAGG